jgi:hypothetical protein
MSTPTAQLPATMKGANPNNYDEIGGKRIRIARVVSGEYTTDSQSTGQFPIDTSAWPYSSVTLVNNSGTTVYVGQAGVSSAGGRLVNGSSMTISSPDPDERIRLRDIFITSGTGTSGLTVDWFAVG